MTYAEQMVQQYRGKLVLLDSKLLLLYMIGSFERRRITIFKRTSDFSEADFDVLASFLQLFRAIVTTPHLLTEVNGLANSLPLYLKESWHQHFAEQVTLFVEVSEAAVDLVAEEAFLSFGLADAAVQNASAETLVLTEDSRLAGFLLSLGVGVLNFESLVDAS